MTAEPLYFDVNDGAAGGSDAATIEPWKTIRLEPDYGGLWVVAGDLDGDGTQEIVMAVSGSTIPRGQLVNGYLDNESQIVMLNEDGTQRWSRTISSGYGGCICLTCKKSCVGNKYWIFRIATGY